MSTTSSFTQRPRLTNSLNPEYFDRSVLPKAYELAKQQKFGKDNINQSYTTDASFSHTILLLYKSQYLQKKDLKQLWAANPSTKTLWTEWKRVKSIDFRPLQRQNPNWKKQTSIPKERTDMRLSCLFHYNMDLAAVHRFIGGNHIGAHRDPDVIIP